MDYRIVYVNAEAIFAIMFVVLYVLEWVNRRGQMPKKLTALYVFFALTIVLDSTWILIDGKPELRSINMLVNTLYLAIMASMGFLWFAYTLDMFPSKTILRKIKPILAIPVLIYVVLVLSSFKTGWVFTIDEGGSYVRAPLHGISFIMNYIFTLMGSYVTLQSRKEAQLLSDKRRLFVAALFPVPIIVFTVIQFMLPPGLPAMQGGVMISLLLIYATNMGLLVTRDHLTSLPNRYSFEQALVSEIENYREDSHLYLMEGDIDRFKIINDTLGHPIGDKVLELTAKVLPAVFSSYTAQIFRVGGDEFMIIVKSENPIDVDSIREKINYELRVKGEPFDINLEMSLGAVEYSSGTDFKALIEQVDKELYNCKNRSPSM